MLENRIVEILSATKGSTIARLCYTTPVKPAAKFKSLDIQKTTVASVLLFGTVAAYKNAYLRRVQKTALAIADNDSQAVANFELSQNWHIASEFAYSIRLHTDKGTKYLFPMFCSKSIVSFTIDGKPATRDQVAEFLTPSERDKLLDDSGTVENKKNGIKHMAIVRTILFNNINWLKIKGKFLSQ